MQDMAGSSVPGHILYCSPQASAHDIVLRLHGRESKRRTDRPTSPSTTDSSTFTTASPSPTAESDTNALVTVTNQHESYEHKQHRTSTLTTSTGQRSTTRKAHGHRLHTLHVEDGRSCPNAYLYTTSTLQSTRQLIARTSCPRVSLPKSLYLVPHISYHDEAFRVRDLTCRWWTNGKTESVSAE